MIDFGAKTLEYACQKELPPNLHHLHEFSTNKKIRRGALNGKTQFKPSSTVDFREERHQTHE